MNIANEHCNNLNNILMSNETLHSFIFIFLNLIILTRENQTLKRTKHIVRVHFPCVFFRFIYVQPLWTYPCPNTNKTILRVFINFIILEIFYIILKFHSTQQVRV
jgi:hypothetical protein